MSKQVQRRTSTRPAKRPATRKAENRATAKATKRATAVRRARLRRLREALQAGFWGLVVLGVVVGVVMLFGDSGQQSPAGGQPSASADQSADDPQFPPLPERADPALATKPTATAGSGELTELKVTTLIDGTGPAAQSGQQITVNYVGVSFRTGEEFDSSWQRSQPYMFELGAGQVIPGWDQGLVGVKVGSRVQLDIPSELAYGDTGRLPGPLRFIVDVLEAR